MKKRVLSFVYTSILFSAGFPAMGQGTAFTYQGRLNDGINAATGRYDFRLRLASDALGNVYVGSTLLTNSVPVSNGLFVLTLDFGLNFPGADRWLEIGVRTNAAGNYTTLTPLTQLSATPYAVTARNMTGVLPGAGLSGTYSSAVTLNNNANSFSGNGAGLTGLNASGLTTGTVADSRLSANVALLNQPAVFTAGLETAQLRSGDIFGSRLSIGSAANVTGFFGSITGGEQNTNQANDAVIAGGYQNLIRANATFASIGGGSVNTIEGGANSAAIGGGQENAIQTNATWGFIGGGIRNVIQTNATAAIVAGGFGNVIGIASDESAIVGGAANTIETNSTRSFIGGGSGNKIEANTGGAAIGGGNFNAVRRNGDYSMIAGGFGNVIENDAQYSLIGGGLHNTNSGNYSVVSGGLDNVAVADFSFAAGRRAKALHAGSFVWADTTNVDFTSTFPNQFLVRSHFTGFNRATRITPQEFFGIRAPVVSGFGGMYMETLGTGNPFYGYAQAGAVRAYTFVDGDDTNKWKLSVGGISAVLTVTTTGEVGIGTTTPTNKLHVVGGITCTALVQTSDRNAKTNFASVSAREVLAKVAVLPIMTWKFKEMNDGRHMGPMAQDFHAAFGLGNSDSTITAIDTDGVALAAIQGLNQKVEEKEARIAELERTVADLKQIVGRLTSK